MDKKIVELAIGLHGPLAPGIALAEDAYKFSDLMDKWMMRKGRLTLLEMDENYFSIQNVKIKVIPKFESSEIVKCAECGDLIPIGLTKNGICKVCIGEGYYY